MAAENALCLERTFEYCHVRWSIRDISFVSNHEEYILRSADFTVYHPRMTKWRLILKSYWTVDGENILSVSLERLESHVGPRTVWVSWRVGILNFEDDEHCHVECESYFERSHTCALDVLSFPEVCRVSHDDGVVITCQMIVDHDHNAKKVYDLDNIHSGLKSLSEDLRGMCNRSNFYDITVKIDGKCFRAHRSILAARNTILCDIMSGTSRTVEFLDLDSEALEKVLRYLYTGNLVYIFENPTIALYACLEFFNMKELMAYFSGQKIFMVTRIMTVNYTINWQIPNIIYRTEDYLSTDSTEMSDTDEMWRLHLYPRGVGGNSTYMDLFIEYVKGSKPIDVCVEFAVLDRYSGLVLEAKRYGYMQVSARLAVTPFMDRGLLSEVIWEDTLNIVVTVRESIDEHFSTIISQNQQRCPPLIPCELYYNGLAMNMKQLYFARAYFDVNLIAEGRQFPAHRCVLAARSRMFSKILSKFRQRILKLNIEADTLNRLLQYIYSGCLGSMGINELKRLYATALNFYIPSLKNYCVQSLNDMMAQDTVVDILVFADDRKDDVLKSAALDFIRMSPRNEQSNQELIWEHLVDDRPTLYQDIINYITLLEPAASDNSNS